jgi:hypothetical protein
LANAWQLHHEADVSEQLTNKDLFLAILAMDAYHRGHNPV